MTRLARTFAAWTMLPLWDDFFVSLPKICEAHALSVSQWHSLPQAAAGDLAAVSNGISDDLASAPALGQPNPFLVFAPVNKRPEFVKFQHVALNGGAQRFRQRRQSSGFFLTSPPA